MIIRKANERGLSDLGWLKSQHTFSFADYQDPKYKNFKTLQVINEDRIQGGTGFEAHSHKNMEIISYVMEGALEHQDSMGNKTIIRPGEIQRMSAGRGVIHSEYNHEKNKETHFYQIWITPNKKNIDPNYGQKSFEAELKQKKLVLVISNTGRQGSISIEQDADVYISKLKKGESLEFQLQSNRHAWIQIIKGHININGIDIRSGDGLSISEQSILKFNSLKDSEFMLFDL